MSLCVCGGGWIVLEWYEKEICKRQKTNGKFSVRNLGFYILIAYVRNNQLIQNLSTFLSSYPMFPGFHRTFHTDFEFPPKGNEETHFLYIILSFSVKVFRIFWCLLVAANIYVNILNICYTDLYIRLTVLNRMTIRKTNQSNVFQPSKKLLQTTNGFIDGVSF